MPFTRWSERQLLARRVRKTSGQREIQLDSTALRPFGVQPKAIHRACASGLLPAALLVSVALGGTTGAAAPGVTCGSTVTTDVTLTTDLHCPSGDGIILASNVTLDLGGHSLVGAGSGVGVQTSLLSQGNTIRNGTIENWGTGILLQEQNPGGVPYTVSDVVLLNAPVGYFMGNTSLQLTRITAVDSMIEGQLGGDLAISQSRLTRSAVNVFFASATITDSTLVQSPVNTSAQGQIIVDSSTLDGEGPAPWLCQRNKHHHQQQHREEFRRTHQRILGRCIAHRQQVHGDDERSSGRRQFAPRIRWHIHISGNTFTRSGVVSVRERADDRREQYVQAERASA